MRILPGDAFVVYAPGPDGKSMKAVALQIEDMMTAGIYGAANGEPRKFISRRIRATSTSP
ncbi:hypothetical protein M5E88_00040 [Akkermansia muciniphila]|nr:hypothetical protein M5E88_00040 [Akkermansia muciniphila]